ncbi:MAG: redoxin family protein [Planctomycetes bacterium]|nr:redoxin family protein [Planctomycetota bacterium]
MKTTLRTAALLAITGLCPSCKFLARQVVPHVERWANGLTKREGRLEGGLQTGDWTYYYESGQRRAHGRYADDHQTGPWTYWFENGGIEWTGAFDDRGKRTGEWTFFHADGATRARGSYVGDFEDGPWEFFGQDGALERSGQYDAGKLSGPWQYFHPGGKPKAAGLCHRGQRIGVWRIWDEAGNESAQDFGVRPGVRIVREQWPGGALRRAGVLQDGAAVGRWTLWHENGALRFCCTLRGAEPGGVFEARDERGSIVAHGVFGAGQPAADAAGDAPAVAQLAAEIAQPVDTAALAAETPAGAPSPAAKAVVAELAQQPERIPAPMQPRLTVLQEQERETYVQNYIEGASPQRPSLRKYAPAPGVQTTGVRRRSDLEGKPLPVDVLTAVDGTTVDLRQFRGKKPVLLVILRGFVGEVCVYCIAQTEALARCQSELEALGLEVLVLYPGAKENEESFERAYRMTFEKGAPPYRVFYDPDLAVVQQLGIAGDLAHPTTVIVDEDGIVRYAYVGEHRADRPAAKELMRVVKGLAK